MNSEQKKALETTRIVDIPIQELIDKGGGISEAAEDEDFYYIVTRHDIDDEHGDCFWVIDKKTSKAVRADVYVGWVFAMEYFDSSGHAIRQMQKPYNF